MLKDMHEFKATRAMEAAFQRPNQVIVSTLCILEVLDVMRKRICEKERYAGLNEQAKAAIIEKINQKSAAFVDFLIQLEQKQQIKFTDPAIVLSQYLFDTLRLYKNNCSTSNIICDRTFIEKQYKFHGLGFYDLQHALNAKECCADEIVSLDKGFNQLRILKDFINLRISVL
jgi:predicted nucleic acid-binding protein